RRSPSRRRAGSHTRRACVSKQSWRSIALEPFHQSRAGQQLQLRLEADHPSREVLESGLLALHSFGLAVDLVFELDHRGQRAPNLVGVSHQETFRLARFTVL